MCMCMCVDAPGLEVHVCVYRDIQSQPMSDDIAHPIISNGAFVLSVHTCSVKFTQGTNITLSHAHVDLS
jgi:hypothetical protein